MIPGLIHTDLRLSVDAVLDEIEDRVRGTGVLGGQRQYEAAMDAIRGINPTSPAPFFGDAVDAVVGGIAVQRAVTYGQTVTPGSGAAARTALAPSPARRRRRPGSGARRQGADGSSRRRSARPARCCATSQADQQVFQSQLLRDDGDCRGAERAADVRGALER